ncbi:PepSY domain-containing protein [Gimibacter soli]|uniref:PepSY domain-containing protein n=1 Tax=Gimibacter soli TaxID=3024400 RepID=A0AAE9XSR5_9PROT|nr:PepSY domain-containing protein [Gimibacter soli]WCL53375.1 PepSY domain-containing protein [Gimibacter soli]
MRFSFLVRRWHKWLSLIIGVQALLWLISGIYMVTVNLDFIHGDHLVTRLDEPVAQDAVKVFMPEISARYPEARSIHLRSWLGKPVYRVDLAEGAILLDAGTGTILSPISEAGARAVASYHYALDGEISSVALIDSNSDRSTEIQANRLPMWQVSFDDAGETRFYISPSDGRLVVKRHRYWRWFDFVWMFHIMDYETRDDINNNLLRLAALLGTLTSLAGLCLLFYSFNRKKSASVEGGAK